MREHIILLVDASGSMGPNTNETRKSIYSIIKELNKETHFTLVFFDTAEYKIVVDDLNRDIAPEIGYIFKANGGTPITDSVYKAIQDITTQIEDIESFSEKHKIIIFTDGEENSSKYVEAGDLGGAIEHFTNDFGWDFQFIGPKSCEKGINQYTNSIKIKPENVSLYTDINDGLNKMKEMAINA